MRLPISKVLKRCLFLYLLLLALLVWTFRGTLFNKAELFPQYSNRKMEYFNSNGNTRDNASILTSQRSGALHEKPNRHQNLTLPKRQVMPHSVSIIERKTSMTSFSLWKSIRLHPEDKRGKQEGHRFGEPLPLYLDAEKKTSVISRTKKWPYFRKSNNFINCTSLFLGDNTVPESLQEEITSDMKKTFIESTSNAKISCEKYVRNAKYITEPLSQMEAEFPIAYSVLMYIDVEQFEILLRTIYRPQNVYCIHVDKKSPRELHDDVKTIASCFRNVHVTSYSVDVRWGTFTILEAEMICLKELWRIRSTWKYFINLTGQDFPLRTNYELVKILKSYNGANNVNAGRLIKGLHDPNTRIPANLKKAGPPPFKLTPVVGSTHVVLSREFVDFLLHNETSLAFFNWTRNIPIPDEKFFSTMNYNKQLKPPGGYKGDPQTSAINPFLGRLKHWIFNTNGCHGKVVHFICIFGTKDLPLLATREELFVNKLHFGYHPEVMLCMQELLYNRTVEEYEGRLKFNVTYYATRDFVNNKF